MTEWMRPSGSVPQGKFRAVWCEMPEEMKIRIEIRRIEGNVLEETAELHSGCHWTDVYNTAQMLIAGLVKADREASQAMKTPKELDLEEVELRFTYHSPSEVQIGYMHVLREHAKNLAELVVAYVPDSRERNLALTKLEEAVMHANSGIVRRSKP